MTAKLSYDKFGIPILDSPQNLKKNVGIDGKVQTGIWISKDYKVRNKRIEGNPHIMYTEYNLGEFGFERIGYY